MRRVLLTLVMVVASACTVAPADPGHPRSTATEHPCLPSVPPPSSRALPTPAPAHDPPTAAPAAPLPAPTATRPLSASRIERDELYSQALGRSMSDIVYLPPGYDSSPSAHFPVLYMLHGASGSNGEWQADGLFRAADRLIGSQAIQPLIIVLPQGDQSFWMDWANAGPQWGAYLNRDVVLHIDGQFRTYAEGAQRAVGGLSMGADGALVAALSHPDEFGVVGAHSPTLRTYPTDHPQVFGNRAEFSMRDPFALVHAQPEVARSLQIWVDVGLDDGGWRKMVEAFHAQLQADGVPHAFHEWHGGHSGDYWSAHVEDYLRFYGTALASPPAGGR